MKKISKYLLMPLLTITSIILVFTLVTAQEDYGKIILTKTATKVYDEVNEKNLEYGRLAKVNLKINANSYKNDVTAIQPLDIVIVFDGSGSMAWGPKGRYEKNGQTVIDWSTPSRLTSAQNSAKDFANTLMDDTGNVQIGIVEFGNSVKDVQNLTANKSTVTTFISDKLDADGGTNLQSGIAKANELLENGRENAKKIVIILTDGIPTYFNYIDDENEVRRAGDGQTNSSRDIEVCTKFEEREYWGNKYTVCTESEEVSRTPSQAAKLELDNLKSTYTTADVYTITFGEESEAATILAEVNPEQATPLYKNYTALTGEDLKGKFGEIIEQTKDIVGKNSVATDVIPKEFTLTKESKEALIAKGIEVKENEDGTTTLTWNIGNIEANKELEISYEIYAKDKYHGSMYTNESATLTTTVEESNPAYNSTSLNLTFDKEQPTVEIPAIANNDHYNDNSSYIAYGKEQIAGTSILTNDLNKVILRDNENDDLTDSVDNTAKVEDIIVVNENVNTVKVENTNNTYKIYKDGTLQGTLVINSDGTFTFQAEENITGEVTFSYHIDSTIDPKKETAIVHSNDAVVTLLINERKTVNISGTKTWADNNDQDGKRPESITVNLLANGTKVASKEVTADKDGNWKYEFNDLYVYELGYENNTDHKITYTIEEIKVEGYTTSIDGYNITNTHTPETTEVYGTKTWDDNNDQDGKRPESITVNLLANGEVVKSATVTEADEWKYSFTNLPVYENGTKITYTIEEIKVEGYTTEINGYDVTNTHTPETTEVSGTKTWKDNNDQDGKRPESITVNLLANGEVVKSVTVTEADEWKYSFTNLPVYENGNKITYTIEEIKVEGYTTEVNGYDITNTHTPEITEVSGTKTWEDNNDQDGKRPESITINLLANGEVIDSKSVTEADEWKYNFTNLPVYENGTKITYTIEEIKVEGYTTEVNGYDITNTHTPETTEVYGTKTWKDNNDQDGKRPESITVNLLANGKVVKSATVTEADEWKYNFTNLPVYENGTKITYTIEEIKVEGYTTEVNGYDVTNTHTPEITEVSGTKIWEDNNNQDGKRPESITVNLLVNGEVIDSKEVTADKDGNWTYTFDDLDKYADGKEITYTVTEDAVEEYTTSIDGYNITNEYTPEITNISGTKTWKDNNNQDGKRPESITVNLLANGKVVKSATVTEANEWKYSFTNLPVYENGTKIIYTITEDAVEGYTTRVEGYNIINTHIPETTEVIGKKIWNDNNNQDGFRPETITVRLYANNEEVNSATITEGENGNWTYAFINLPKYKDSKVIKYTVTEDKVEEYTTTYDETNPYIIINTHQTKKIEVSGTKTWNDNNNQDGKRPEKITVRLYANNEEVASKEVIADEEGNWTYTFENLDMYKEGKLIGYTITEDAVENYSTEIDGYNITNTHTPETITIDGVKTWEDNNDQDGKRPESITINLLKNEEVIATTTATEATNWTYKFENLDKYANGEEIVYTLTEETVEGYVTEINGYDITNSHEIEKITFKTTKVWDDNENQDGIRPTEINVNLYKNGELLSTVKVTEEDNWTYVFENLDRYENGQEIIYTIEEDIVLGYNTEINYDEIDENNIISSTITNIHTPEKIEININKTWNDYDDIEEIRPENINVELYANGEHIKTIIITNQEDWKYTITDLDKYQNGQEIIYTIKEQEVEGYTTEYDGFNIINTHELGKGGDVEELPPQTGIEIISTTTKNSNTMIYLIISLLSLWIIGLKKVFN